MITIYTRTKRIFSKEYIKYTLARLLKKQRGPNAVFESLIRGLIESKVPFQINPPYKKVSDAVHVLSGIQALKDCIELKKAGRIKRLTAGPNLTLTPYENDSLYYSKEIDKILFPSMWAKKYFVNIDAYFNDKIAIWPAGVKDPGEPHISTKKRDGYVLLYIKQCPDIIREEIVRELRNSGIKYCILQYGKYKPEEFFKLLGEVSCMIYMSNSESQGLALLEAWARDIPTLVWDRGYWEYKQYRLEFPGMSAPYLTDEAGMFFYGKKDFASRFLIFKNSRNLFEPRNYFLKHFTDKKIAGNFINLIKK